MRSICNDPRGPLITTAVLVAVMLTACVPGVRPITPTQRAIAEAARPILEGDPDAVWTSAYNRLLELAPGSLTYLAEHPRLARRAAPDDLRVMLHTSLLRLLVHPGQRPRVTAGCLETTLDVLHFDLKVGYRSIGRPLQREPRLPAAWHDLYAEAFDQAAAARVDAEADRQAIRAWWREHRDRPHAIALAPRLAPRAEDLWGQLPSRYADRWVYQPEPRAVRCARRGPEPVLLWEETCDYNLTRAVCVWLGSSRDDVVRDRLIELIGSDSPIVAHNALFALAHAPDERIRAVLKRYKGATERPVPAGRSPDGVPGLRTQAPGKARQDTESSS